MAPAALSLITVMFTLPKERAKAFGVFGAISGGGAAIGLIVGGVLTEYLSWRWCLGVNIPIALGTALAAMPVVRESKAPGRHPLRHPRCRACDAGPGLPGLRIHRGSAAQGLRPTSTECKAGPSTRPCASWIAAVVLLVAFVLWETRAENPLLPLRVILERNRGGSYLVFLLVGAGLFAMFLFLGLLLPGNLGTAR